MNEDYTADNAAIEESAEVGYAADTEDTGELEGSDSDAQSPDEADSYGRRAQTKAYSQRLNAERERIRVQAQDDLIANASFYDERGYQITTRVQYDAWKSRRAEQALREEFSSSYEEDPAQAITKLLDDKLSSHPAILEAKRLQANTYFSKQIGALNAVFPDSGINSIGDFTNHPKFKVMDALMSADPTVSMLDAYQAAYHKELLSRKSAAVKQAAYFSESSRSHLRGTSLSGGEQVHVPAEVMAMYKGVNPRATDKEIREHYARSKGR